MSDLWKKIPGFENYECNVLGQIRNAKTKQIRKFNINNGYHRIGLVKEDRHIHMKVHRLIALTWIPNPENKSEIDHIDRNKLNNCVSNLRWFTPAENVKAYYESEHAKNRGTHQPVKFENDDHTIYFYSISEACRHFERCLGTIWGAIENSKYIENYKYKGYKITCLTEKEYSDVIEQNDGEAVRYNA